jgi:hypothetical protein
LHEETSGLSQEPFVGHAESAPHTLTGIVAH